jgi:hypothetical protein
MRLFKFLVISDEVMEKSKMKKPVVRVRLGNRKDGVLNVSKSIATKNKFYFYCQDLYKIQTEILTQYNLVGSKKGLVLMSLDYPNELREFRNNNKAYVIIDPDNIDEVMKAIAPAEYRNEDNFQVCSLKTCNNCMEISKPCRNKNVSIHVDKNNIRGKTWSFANDKAGTKSDVTEDLAGNLITRRIEPKTGGIAYSSIQWKDGIRPEAFKEKTIAVPLHHWIKCHSIPNKPVNKSDYSFYHIGHIFDYRKEFIGLATKREQERLRKEIEPKNNIYRGRRVLAGQKYFSRTLECDCGLTESNPKCRDCPGVLYIDTEQGLVDLYNQLMSDEYKQLREGKTI